MRKIFVSTDIGRDADDTQSLIHLLHIHHLFDLKGISLCWPGGYRNLAIDVVKAYKRDYKYLKNISPSYLTAKELRSLIYDGCKNRKGLGQDSEGVNKIIELAQASTLADPLYVLTWGGATDLANAIQKKPSIKKNILAHVIAGWNREQDPESHQFLMEQKDLKWINNESTGRGMYLGWPIEKNRKWVAKNVAPAGSMGKLFSQVSQNINIGRGCIKMGDTPTLLWALSCNPNKIGAKSLAGAFKKDKDSERWDDKPGSRFKFGHYIGVRTQIKRRGKFLKMWKKVLNEINKQI